MSRRASVYVVRREHTDGGESPNRYVSHITVEIRVFFPPHTPTGEVEDLFVNAAAETLGDIRSFVDIEPRNVWLRAPVTTYSPEEIATMDDFAAEPTVEDDE